MSPTHSRKSGVRYRCYTSRALTEDRRSEAGAIARVAADDVESKVVEALLSARGAASEAEASSPDRRGLIQSMVSRVVIAKDRLAIEITEIGLEAVGQPSLSVPWVRRPSKPKRDLVLPVDGGKPNPRPMYAEWRAKHLRAIAQGRKWLQELIGGKVADVETIATREGRSVRSASMMLSLAFVAPDIVEAAAAGRLPRGIGVTRLTDLPMSWAKQKETLGLPARF